MTVPKPQIRLNENLSKIQQIQLQSEPPQIPLTSGSEVEESKTSQFESSMFNLLSSQPPQLLSSPEHYMALQSNESSNAEYLTSRDFEIYGSSHNNRDLQFNFE